MANAERICAVLIRDAMHTRDPKTAERSRSLFYNVVVPSAEASGFRCTQIDPMQYGRDDPELFRVLSSADALVVDASAKSMDYMYSLGVRHALTDKPTFVFVEADHIPFDVQIP